MRLYGSIGRKAKPLWGTPRLSPESLQPVKSGVSGLLDAVEESRTNG